ncbi:NEDD8-conjugating enzyme Ubc12 [Aphanomyces cochlioides]|nr:NEDD8-conjugating enzyme Ubc12 [Aphanomyces cochlioides]
MIKLKMKKQKAEEEAAAAAAAQAASSGTVPSSAPSEDVDMAAPSGGDDQGSAPAAPATGGTKIFGLGRGTRKPKEKKRTPGEIRIQKDIAELDGGSAAVVSFPDTNDLTNFEVKVKVDTGLWTGASYNFTFKIPPLYPHEPPKVRCMTKIYHPNIDLDGNVCLNILREDWKPVLDINAVIYGLIYLFYEPNPDDPLNREAAELFRNDPHRFQDLVARSLRGQTVQGIHFERLV